LLLTFSSRALQRAIDAELPNCMKRSKKAVESTFINRFAANESGSTDDDSSFDPDAEQDEEEKQPRPSSKRRFFLRSKNRRITDVFD